MKLCLYLSNLKMGLDNYYPEWLTYVLDDYDLIQYCPISVKIQEQPVNPEMS